jgi:hypothetical protein
MKKPKAATGTEKLILKEPLLMVRRANFDPEVAKTPLVGALAIPVKLPSTVTFPTPERLN